MWRWSELDAWVGQLLHVDLTKEKIWKEPFSEHLGEKFIGGRGLNAKFLYDLVRDPQVDPLGPENVLIFGTGPLTGTTAPSSGRSTVTCKGPITNLYLKTSMGGQWGAELKFAGYDHLIIYGTAKAPSYLWINDTDVELRPAADYWGLDVRETDHALKRDLNEKEAKITTIGPAGENQVKFAAIMNSVYHAAGRGGAGAVMGSKKLKAIATRGTGAITVADPEKFTELAINARKALTESTPALGLYNYGTSGGVEAWNAMGDLPCFNFQAAQDDKAPFITGEYFVKAKYLQRRVGCFACSISCHRYTVVEAGPYAGVYSGGPEYETCYALGSGTGVFDTAALLKANELCNILGLDTISTGNVIQWAMETYEHGVLTKEDTNGLNLKFGNAETLVQVIPLIAWRKGKLGDLLAEGTQRAADKIGHDSWKWAMNNSKGLTMSGTDTRFTKGYALAFAVNPRGPDHLHSQVLGEYGGSPDAIALIEKITGDKKWASPIFPDYRPEIVRFYEDVYSVTDALGFCTFTGGVVHTNPDYMSEIFTAATGIAMSSEHLLLIGRRILTLEKSFNVRLGTDRKLDDLPYRMMREPAPPGARQEGVINSPEELNAMLDRYYELHGWDLKSSWPRRETLEHLDLKDVAKELEELGKLPEEH